MEPPRPRAPDSGFFKRVGEELRRSEERYRSLFENMGEAVAHCRLVFDGGRPVDVVFLEVNAAFERLTGLRDVAGRRFTQTLPGVLEKNLASFEACVRVASDRRPEKFETLVQPLGVWLSVSVHAPERDCLVVVFDDITKRKQSEESLRESNARFLVAFRASPVAQLLTTLSEGRVIDANEVFLKDLGFARDEVVGRAVPELNLFDDPEDRDRLLQELRDGGSIYAREARFRTRAGELLICLVSIVRVPIDGRNCLLSSILDITGRKTSEARLTGQLEELRRWHEATLGREIRVLELKKEVNDLLALAGKPPRYPSATAVPGGGPDG
jgi:PAS domain S-box-containing protein